MAHSSNSKLVLKSTTKMSLNDRFSAYRKNAEISIGAMRQRALQETQQNSKNWRLIQQLENRPSVIAALKIKKRSLKQRLGIVPKSNVKARLSLGGGSGRIMGQIQRFRGGARGRLSRRGGRNRGGGAGAGGGRGGGNQFANNFGNSFRGSQWSLSSASQLQGRLGSSRDNGQQQWKPRRGVTGNGAGVKGHDARNRLGRGGRDFRRGRATFRATRGNFRRQGQYRINAAGQQRGAGRGGKRGVNRGGRGRGRSSQQQALPTKQALDNELDEYMSRTRGNLDMELDSYMAQTQAE